MPNLFGHPWAQYFVRKCVAVPPSTPDRRRLSAIRWRIPGLVSIAATLSVVCIIAPKVPVRADDYQTCVYKMTVTRSPSKEDRHVLLQGTVFDANRAVVTQGRVTILNEKTREVRSVLTSAEGQFRFAQLDAGDYTVLVESNGFRACRKKNMDFKEGEEIEVSITLYVGQIAHLVPIINQKAMDSPLAERRWSATILVLHGIRYLR